MIDNTTAVLESPHLGVGSSARSARRWLLIAAPVLAGLLAVLGAATDPAVNQDGAALYRQYAAHPGVVQVQVVAYHFSYALLGVAALALAGLVRGRGGWPANAAAVLAVLGISTQPGFLVVDFYASAAGQVFGADASRLDGPLDHMWGFGLLAVTGLAGFVLCLPLAAFAAWRAGLVPWWAIATAAVGVVGFLVVGADVPGALVMTAAFAALSLAAARIDRGAWAVPVRRAGNAAS